MEAIKAFIWKSGKYFIGRIERPWSLHLGDSEEDLRVWMEEYSSISSKTRGKGINFMVPTIAEIAALRKRDAHLEDLLANCAFLQG